MQENKSRYKTTLDALNVVDKYVSDLKSLANFDVREFLKAERQARAALDQRAFPREIRQAIDRSISLALESYIEIRDLLEEKHERGKTRLEEERRQKNATLWRLIGKVISIVLSLALGVVLLLKDEPQCAMVALFIVMYLLGDALPLKLCFGKTKKDDEKKPKSRS